MAIATTSVTAACQAPSAHQRALAGAGTASRIVLWSGSRSCSASAAPSGGETRPTLPTNARRASPSLRDRLTLTEERMRAMAEGVRAIAALRTRSARNSIGEGSAMASTCAGAGAAGRSLGDLREGAAELTVDCAAPTLKSGWPGRYPAAPATPSARTRRRCCWCAKRRSSRKTPKARSSCSPAIAPRLRRLATAEGLVDLVIAGGEGLKAGVEVGGDGARHARRRSGCHVYVRRRRPRIARRIAFNAKVDRPEVCNAAETLLVNMNAFADRRSHRRRGRAGRRRSRRRRPPPGMMSAARPTTPTGTPSSWG